MLRRSSSRSANVCLSVTDKLKFLKIPKGSWTVQGRFIEGSWKSLRNLAPKVQTRKKILFFYLKPHWHTIGKISWPLNEAKFDVQTFLQNLDHPESKLHSRDDEKDLTFRNILLVSFKLTKNRRSGILTLTIPFKVLLPINPLGGEWGCSRP